MGRNGYRRGYDQPEHGGAAEQAPPRGPAPSGSASSRRADFQSPQAAVSDLERQLSGVGKAFTENLEKISVMENQKFDQIFLILRDLQQRQFQLEDSIRAVKAQWNGSWSPQHHSGSWGQMTVMEGVQPSPMGPVSPPGPRQPTDQNGYPGGSHQAYGPANGQMGGPMSPNMQGQQPMQFAGTMNTVSGGQAIFAAPMQQVVMVSPTATPAMQYAMPQMLQPGSGTPTPVAVQFVGINPSASVQGVGSRQTSQEVEPAKAEQLAVPGGLTEEPAAEQLAVPEGLTEEQHAQPCEPTSGNENAVADTPQSEEEQEQHAQPCEPTSGIEEWEVVAATPQSEEEQEQHAQPCEPISVIEDAVAVAPPVEEEQPAELREPASGKEQGAADEDEEDPGAIAPGDAQAPDEAEQHAAGDSAEPTAAPSLAEPAVAQSDGE